MADNTVLNPGVGGDTLRTEDVGGGVKIQAGKTHTGGSGVDGGPVTISNPFPIMLCSGSAVMGTVTNPFFVTGTINSGSVTGLLYGGVAAGSANPFYVTGSVGLTMGPNVVALSGSVAGLLVGGVAVAGSNPVPTTGSHGILIGGVQASLANPVPVQTSLEGGGQILSGTTARTVQYSFGDFGTSGSANQVIAPQGSGNRIRVLAVQLMAPNAVLIRWLSTGSAGTITNISGLMPLAGNGGFVLPHNPHGWFQTAANEGLNLSLSSGVSCGVVLTWIVAGP